MRHNYKSSDTSSWGRSCLSPPFCHRLLSPAIDGDHSMKGVTSKSFQQVVPELTSVIAANCGHFAQEEQPKFLVKTLLDFLPGKL
jgi:pimeloyl-ACP methyl ester carboxylesterase